MAQNFLDFKETNAHPSVFLLDIFIRPIPGQPTEWIYVWFRELEEAEVFLVFAALQDVLDLIHLRKQLFSSVNSECRNSNNLPQCTLASWH